MSMLIRLLGPVDICRNDTITPISAAKRRAMLGALALAENRPVSLDALVEALWGNNPPLSAMQNVRSHAHALRMVLGGRLVTHPGAYELRLDVDELDVTLFTSLADRGTAALAAGDIVGAVTAYGGALGLWRGDALHGVPSTARLDAALVGLQERRFAVFEDYCIARLAGGAASELVPELRRYLISHPFRERAWAALMLAQYRGGDVSGAVASYAQALALLRGQLGLDPGPELVELHRAVLARDARLMIPGRAGRTLGGSHPRHARCDRGEVRLSGVGRHRVHQGEGTDPVIGACRIGDV